MRRNLLVGGVVIALVAAIAFVKCGRGGSGTKTTQSTSAGDVTKAATVTQRDKPIDPRKLQRASISGTVTDLATKAPIAGARVCGDGEATNLSAQQARDPICTVSDAAGAYTLKDLVAARYTLAASAKTYRPAAYRTPNDDDASTSLALKPGEAKTGIDIALRAGGVEITGTVIDITGGPIAQAQVRAASTWSDVSPPVDTDAEGKFSLWANPGRVSVSASADGYVSGMDWGRAPGTFELRLTPESSLSGTVVDAITNQPVSGVRVYLSGHESSWGDNDTLSDISDDQGAFRITKLSPGRYNTHAASPHGFARGDGSRLVGLGQNVEGVIVRLHAGVALSGKVMKPDKTPCEEASWSLRDRAQDRHAMTRSETGGEVFADGVLPGTYDVEIYCSGAVPREKYESITVTDKDINGLVYEVDEGASVRGRLITKAGEPIPDAWINARSTGGAARQDTAWGGTRTNIDGTFLMEGLRAGTYRIETTTDKGSSPRETGWSLEVAAGAKLEKEFVVDDGGKLTGSVTDTNGKPIAGVSVRAQMTGGGGRSTNQGVTTGTDGSFAFESLPPGDYKVSAMRNRGGWLRKPGTTDDTRQDEKVTIVASKTATLKLVYEASNGWIKGTVLDVNGAPTSEAYVTAARESDSPGAQASAIQNTRWGDRKPTITATDGTFTLEELAPGTYALRAYIRGGGEAVVEHVAVGSTTKLQLRPTGTITGTVTSPTGPLEEFEVELRNAKTGFYRSESMFRSNGAFTLSELPAGAYTLTASAANGKKTVELELTDGDTESITLALEGFITITGRVIDPITKQPVAGVSMSTSTTKDNSYFSSRAKKNANVTGDDGRFTIENQPTGSLVIRGWPKDWQNSDYQGVSVIKEVTGTGTIDIGDVAAMKRKVKQGDKPGELGIKWVADPPGTPQDKRIYKVRYIDPAGAAAKTSIKVGDVVVSVDGTDITGANSINGGYLMTGLPGTKLTLGLQGGTSVTIVLAPPS